MLSFVICEDEKVLATEYKNEVDKFMMNYDHEYQIKIFSGYSDEFYKYAKTTEDFKVYLLDIKTPEGSGLDAARIIREEYDDWTSMIMIVTSYNEYKYEALGKRLLLVDFINKLDKCKDRIKEALEICMKHYDNRPKTLRYTYKNVVYCFDFAQIVSIDKEQDSKRCIINLSNKTSVPYQGTISKLMTILDERFERISRGTIINTDYIQKVDLKETSITLKSGQKTYASANELRKGSLSSVRNS